MTKLKPCPFCGEPEMRSMRTKNLWNGKRHYIFRCDNCDIRVDTNRTDSKKAAELFNRRAEDRKQFSESIFQELEFFKQSLKIILR